MPQIHYQIQWVPDTLEIKEIVLSATESEYTRLSYMLCEAIPLMELQKEMKQLGFSVTQPNGDVHCHVFEDNSGAIEMTKVHKFQP